MFRAASRILGLAFALALAASVAAAPSPMPAQDSPGGAKPQKAGKGQVPRIAHVDGPIKISAAHAELSQREVALYTGNVKLTSNELTLTGDRLELRQPARGQFEARLTGRPARVMHAAVGADPPMSASASEIVYDTRKAQMDLTGGVSLSRGTDTLSSDTLHYDIAARRINASAAGKGQVQLTIQPENLPGKKGK